jgi:carbamoyltransferase
MKILGLSKGATCNGKRLRDGGAAVFVDGHIIAVPEARVTGRKYAPGYHAALEALLRSTNLTIDEFDVIGVSTCCEPEDAALAGHELSGQSNLAAIGHHLSHAALSFYGSGFERALVVVIDGGGNVLQPNNYDHARWWTASREQHTYYIGSRKTGLEVVARDFAEPFEVGMAEMYRAFTYYLGWDSATNASKMMALAGHGRRDQFPEAIFRYEDHHLSTPINNIPPRPIEMVLELGKKLGLDFGEPREPETAILQIHKDLAAYIQDECERALLARLKDLKAQFGIDRLCISGGFALNVVINGRLAQMFENGVYVPCAPGDDGQSLGNVLVLLNQAKKGQVSPMTKSSDAFLGVKQSLKSKDVATALKRCGRERYVVFETTDPSDLVAEMLASGAAVCVYAERAEFGPRALGARSILADPRRPDAVSRLNNLKHRDWFMPFAPAVLQENMTEWFEFNKGSPFMSIAVPANPRTLVETPAVVNADGSARIQTVQGDEDGPLPAILRKFYALTGIPILLNTSFNLGGKPIVESIDDAVKSFAGMPLNVLQLGRFVVVKALSPNLADLPLSSSIRNLSLEVFGGSGNRYRAIPEDLPSRMIRELQAATGSVVFVRTELPLYDEYLEWLREGRKGTTIRFRKGGVEIPYNSTLPLFETRDFGIGDRSRPTEYVSVAALRYRRFGLLSREDAKRDGFEGVEHMRSALRKIYPELDDEDWVTVYDIQLQDRMESEVASKLESR